MRQVWSNHLKNQAKRMEIYQLEKFLENIGKQEAHFSSS